MLIDCLWRVSVHNSLSISHHWFHTHSTAPEHRLHSSKSNAMMSWKKRTMVQTVWYQRTFFSLHHPVIFPLQRSLLAPKVRKFGTSKKATWLIWCYADPLVLSVSWALQSPWGSRYRNVWFIPSNKKNLQKWRKGRQSRWTCWRFLGKTQTHLI